MLLRPKENCSSKLDRLANGDNSKNVVESEGIRLVHLGTSLTVIQEAACSPWSKQKVCWLSGITCLTRGSGWARHTSGAYSSCPLCSFKTRPLKLYREIHRGANKPGKNPWELNVALQLGLHQTSISTKGARRLLSCLSLRCPSVSSPQHSANKFGSKMEKKNNESDMVQKRGIIKHTLSLRGLPDDSPIYAE